MYNHMVYEAAWSITMTDEHVVEFLCEYFEGLFPKVCPNCGRTFSTFREYILATKRMGPSRSYEAEFGHWDAQQLVGTVAWSNCLCGSTLALTTEGMDMSRRFELLGWMRVKLEELEMTPSDFLERLRDRVRERTASTGGPQGVT
jgi:hypothetical protein